MLMTPRHALHSAALFTFFLTIFAPIAAANKSTLRTVTACSENGRSSCYTAPVRQTKLGPQMRLKGGAWIWCESDCRDTLRRATIDFWDDQRDRNR